MSATEPVYEGTHRLTTDTPDCNCRAVRLHSGRCAMVLEKIDRLKLTEERRTLPWKVHYLGLVR